VKVSVVVPAYNEEKDIPDLLEALTRQKVPPDEVIVVDDSSTDRTIPVVLSFKSKLPLRVFRIKRNSGIGYARHVGTLKASGDIIAQTDADCIPPEDWVGRIRSAFMSDPALVGLSGKYVEASSNFFKRLGALIANPAVRGLGGNTHFRKSIYPRTKRANGRWLKHHEDVVFWGELRGIGKCVYDGSLFVYHKGDDKWTRLGFGILSLASGVVLRNKPLVLFGTGFTGIELLLWNAKNFDLRKTFKPLRLLPHIHHDAVGVYGLATVEGEGKAFFGGLLAHHLITEGVRLITFD